MDSKQIAEAMRLKLPVRYNGTRAAASKHYDTMTIEDIKRMGVGAAGGGYC